MPLDFRKLKDKNARAAEGVWVDYIDGTEEEGIPNTRFKIARPGKQFQAFIQAKLSTVKRSKRGADMEDALLDPRMEPVYREAYARFVLLDWTNVVGEEGTQVPYSQELGMEALLDQDVFAFVRSCAQDSETYREQALEADAGN